MKSILLSIIQFSPRLLDKEENFNNIKYLTKSLSSDVIVFPELCTTGYCLSQDQAISLAESKSGKTVQFFHDLAKNKKAIVIAGFLEEENGVLYNSCLFCSDKDVPPLIYRKTHLFLKESDIFSSGEGKFPILYDLERDIRIGGMICYDWRFPEVTRLLALNGIDLLVCPSNLITDIWQQVMPGRAIENRIYIAMVNRFGREKDLTFTGNSAVYSPYGECLAQATPNQEEILSVEIFPKRSRDKKLNEYNDLFKDRKNYTSL